MSSQVEQLSMSNSKQTLSIVSFSMHLLTILCLILAAIYWLYRFSRALYNILSYFNIRAFYAQALDIKPVNQTSIIICLFHVRSFVRI
jgi:hypothetical protein